MNQGWVGHISQTREGPEEMSPSTSYAPCKYSPSPVLDKHPPKRILRRSMVGKEGTDDRAVRPAGKQEGGLRRLWQRIVFAWRWIRMPNAVGRPLTLEPRSVRFLLLIIFGNLVALVLLGVALHQAVTMSAAERPTQRELVPVPASQPSPTPGPTPTPLGSGGRSHLA